MDGGDRVDDGGRCAAASPLPTLCALCGEDTDEALSAAVNVMRSVRGDPRRAKTKVETTDDEKRQ